MRIKEGTKVLIEATILDDALDDRPKEKCGYLVATSRGKVYVEPYEIYFPRQEKK